MADVRSLAGEIGERRPSGLGLKLPVERRTEPVVGWRHWLLDGDLLVTLPGIGWEGPVLTTDPDRPTYRRRFTEEKLVAEIPVAIRELLVEPPITTFPGPRRPV